VRIAVVDVGTNTTRLYIADVADGRVVAELTRESRVTRLGAGVDASGQLAADALAREYLALNQYQMVIEAAKPERAVAVMTSAVRDADNGAAFADEVATRYGLETHILSGDQEARLTYLGATDMLKPDTLAADQIAGPTLVIDIGGGSTELVLGDGARPRFHVSTQAGVVRQADRHIHTDPATPAELEAVAQDVRAILTALVPAERRSGIGLALGVAGTPTSLAAIAQELTPYDPSRVHGYWLTAEQRDEIYMRLAPMTLEQRQQVAGLQADRAAVILPGIVILTEVMNLFGLDGIEVSEHDILRGAALHFSRALSADTEADDRGADADQY
jgi:exopolyphosphatase/guanosine-5'-triphosphate,3'-diphosphate pyrophosphatase